MSYRKTINRITLIVWSTLAAIFVQTGCQPITHPPPTPEPGQIVTIQRLKGLDMERFIGKKVTVDGIFVRDPVPMLVTKLDFVLMNMPIPESQYILLSGDNSKQIDPSKFGGAKIRVTGTVNAADSGEGKKPKTVYLADIYFEMIDRLVPYAPKPDEMKMIPNPNPDPRRWAILFSGGIDLKSNYGRYWNDLKFMYKTLVGTLKFSTNNIAVLYADGKAKDKDMPVHYSATQANLQTVFNLLRQNITEKDLIFIFTTNHGGGFYSNDPDKLYNWYGGQLDTDSDEPGDTIDEAKFKLDLNSNGNKKDVVSWDEVLFTWGGSILDDNFHAMVANLKFIRMIIVMEQCFSGGLIHDMAQGGTRIIISAAGEYEPSEAMPPNYDYNEFSYHFTAAINKADHKGSKVDADTDKNGNVSLVEAFNYSRSKDTRPETPWYEDSGDGIPHSGAMPSQGEGTIGGNTTLEP